MSWWPPTEIETPFSYSSTSSRIGFAHEVGTRAKLPSSGEQGGAKRRGGVDQETDFLEPTAPPPIS